MSQKIFDNDLVSVRKIDEPVYVGMCIVDLSKVLIYKFHYDYIKNKHGNNSGLLFTDIDSLMYEIKAKDVYEDFSQDKEMFGFSNYSFQSKYMKIETN